MATVGFNSGRHYWEIKLDTFVDLEDILIGVARRNIELSMKTWDSGSFWGWICTGYYFSHFSFCALVEENYVQHSQASKCKNTEACQR